jgi:hypothetical protein
LNRLTKLVFTRTPFSVVAKPEREPMIREAINSDWPASIRFVRVSYLRRTPRHFGNAPQADILAAISAQHHTCRLSVTCASAKSIKRCFVIDHTRADCAVNMGRPYELKDFCFLDIDDVDRRVAVGCYAGAG